MIDRLRAWWGLRTVRHVAVDGAALTLPPGVLDPVLFRVGAWFAREIAADVKAGERLLDLGTGSGVVGLLAARAGARVTATDVDPRACAAARANGLADVREGDLFLPIGEERFDRICFNPPYFPALPTQHPLGLALYGGPGLTLVRRFASEARAHLAPGGKVWMAWSERAPDAAGLLGPEWRRARIGTIEGERLEIWER